MSDIAAQMRAAVMYGREDVRIESRPTPSIGPNDLLLRVTRSGICGTDATEFSHGPRMFPVERRHPVTGHQGPMVLGHEFIGEVVDAGAVTGAAVGTRLASGAGVSCGECSWCHSGRTNLCERYWTLGLNADGGLAQYVAVPAATCVTISDDCGDDAAGLAQPLAVGLHAARRAGVTGDDTVVVVGTGAIGSFILCGLVPRRPARIVAVDIDEDRLSTAANLGATDTLNVSGIDPVAAVTDLLGGQASLVVESSGVHGAAQNAIRMTARGGRTLLVGLAHAPQEINLADATLREVDLITTVAHVCREDMPEALELLRREALAKQLLDRVVPLDDLVEHGLQALVTGKARGKILVDPWA